LLKEIKGELDINIDNPDAHTHVIDEIETQVIEPLLTSIDSLQDLLESIRKMDDADAFYDPYNEGME
jgi:hypothetical protein